MGIHERKDREKEIRRSQILKVAKKLFYSKGLNSPTIEEIATGAELSPGSLYSYFKNKDEIFATLNINLLKFMLEKVKKIECSTELTPQQKLDALSVAWYDTYRADPQLFLSMVRSQASEDLVNISDGVLSEMKQVNKELVTATCNIFNEGFQKEAFIKCHPVALGDIIWAIVTGLVLWEESKKTLDPRKNYLKSTLDLALEIISRGLTKTN